jgi:hypothetical protein
MQSISTQWRSCRNAHHAPSFRVGPDYCGGAPNKPLHLTRPGHPNPSSFFSFRRPGRASDRQDVGRSFDSETIPQFGGRTSPPPPLDVPLPRHPIVPLY